MSVSAEDLETALDVLTRLEDAAAHPWVASRKHEWQREVSLRDWDGDSVGSISVQDIETACRVLRDCLPQF